MKLRYLFGVPFLFVLAMSGQSVLFEAIVIGILSGFTDISRDNNNNIRPS
tara:strand:- start:2501 stop:2650 length:150 start_codon:yes stop_codon:yes gene_type:complete